MAIPENADFSRQTPGSASAAVFLQSCQPPAIGTGWHSQGKLAGFNDFPQPR
jgi:hypothetical protein